MYGSGQAYGDLMEIYGHLLTRMEMYGFMEIYGALWRSLELYGNNTRWCGLRFCFGCGSEASLWKQTWQVHIRIHMLGVVS